MSICINGIILYIIKIETGWIVFLIILMVIDMKVIGKMIKKKEKEFIIIKMEINMM